MTATRGGGDTATRRHGDTATPFPGSPRLRVSASPRLRVSTHWPLLAVLAVGLAIRLPHLGEQFEPDAAIWSSFASTLFEPGRRFAYYHLSRLQPYPYGHPPLFPILFAPFNWLALTLGGSYIVAANLLIHLFEVLGTVLLYALARRCLADEGRRTEDEGRRTKDEERRTNDGSSRAVALPSAVRRPPSAAVAALLAAFFYLGPLTPLWIEEGKQGTVDTHFVAVAVALLLATLWRQQHPAQAGALYGLALATRSEMAFLGAPLALHLLRRGPRAAGAFAAAAGAVVGIIVLPFWVRDPAAFDWALRGHVVPRLVENVPLLWRWPSLGLDEAALAPLLPYNGAVMVGAIAGTTLLFRRDPWLERYLLLVGLAHALTLPVFHIRYVAYVYALALVYAARAGVPHLFGAWFLATSHTGHTALTLGIPWLGLAWQSLRATGGRRHEGVEGAEGAEGEHGDAGTPRRGDTATGRHADGTPQALPLPAGEGRGEGEEP